MRGVVVGTTMAVWLRICTCSTTSSTIDRDNNEKEDDEIRVKMVDRDNLLERTPFSTAAKDAGICMRAGTTSAASVVKVVFLLTLQRRRMYEFHVFFFGEPSSESSAKARLEGLEGKTAVLIFLRGEDAITYVSM